MVATAAPQGSFFVSNGALPCEGTKAFPFNLDFTGGKNAYSIDLTPQYQQKQFTTLQTVFIDNSGNASSLEVICSVTNQVIVAPPNSQGYYAILQPTPPQFIVQTLGGVALQIILLNFYIPPTVWTIGVASAGGLPQIDIPAIDAIISGGKLQTQNSPITVSGPTDGSGTIAAGGTAQDLFAANASRKRWLLCNPSTATEILQFEYGNTGHFIDLPPGGVWDESGQEVSGDLIRVVAATTAHAFTAYSWG